MFGRFLDPALLLRTYRDPVAWGALAVDLIPVYAVLVLGWGAVPLVMLYWLENLVIGAVAVLRMVTSGLAESSKMLFAAILGSVFFVFHYGMFCFVHGQFLNVFASISTGGGDDFLGPVGLINSALQSGPYLPVFVAIIAGWLVFVFAWDFLVNGGMFRTDIGKEMAAPYGRILVLHIGIFAGAGALIAFGQPMAGVLALILLRVVWGVVLSMMRRLRLDQPQIKS